ncbi:MAG: tRNA pseudouridine(55) synthase TruB [Myxococcaceae bacterium]|nr:tRNA pseudouridine(55) synthase TruB [Myxococcaceae bacterium]MCI0671003.1 tRNA pseudouridine(55) synthase TruB [Myxococcaceae bacterium]
MIAPMHPGIYLVHKSVGDTSFSLVRAFMQEVEAAGLSKRQLPVSHGGTLDPFAEGLLLVLVGQATRLMDSLHPAPKTYVAEVVWGTETDNGDLQGKVVFQGDASGLTPERLDAALTPFLGWHEQVPPATSAKKVGGEPAYKKAHRGEAVELPPSRVYLHEARWLSHELPHRSRLELTCRGGFYVRALARDMGRALGCGAHLSRLHRTSIGPWSDPGPDQRVWLHGRELLPWLPARVIKGDEINDLKHGRTIPVGELQSGEWRMPEGFPAPRDPLRAFQRGRLVALLHEEDGRLRTVVELWGGL